MKRRLVLATLIAAAVGGSAPDTGAQMMGGGGMGFFSNGIGRGTATIGAAFDMQAVASAWLKLLHEQLQVASVQEPAWQAFATAVTAQAAAMQSMRTLMIQSVSLDTPHRLLLAEELMQRRLTAMHAVTDTVTALYAQLTPAQRAILDQGSALQCGPYGLFGS